MPAILLFDEENQQGEITLLKKWKLDYNLTYKGYTIKNEDLNFQSLNIEEKVLYVILVGPGTRFLSAQFMDDVKLIIESTNAILCLNLNGTIGLDEDHCPRILWDCGALHMPFGRKDVAYLLEVMKLDNSERNPSGSFHLRKHSRPFDME